MKSGTRRTPDGSAMSRRRRPDWPGHALQAYAVVFFGLLYLPIAIVVLFSFNDSRLLAQWSGFTLDWYFALLDAPEVWLALANSVGIAVATALLSVGLAVFAGYAIVKFRFRGRGPVEALIFVPIAIAEIPLATSVYLLLGESRLTLGLVAIILGHSAFAVAFAILVIRSRMARFDFALEQAAQSLGATPAAAFFKVTLPLNYPALFAAGLLAFLLSLDDFYMTFWLAPPGTETLPTLIFSMAARGGVTPLINAVSVVMLIVSIPFSLLLIRSTLEPERRWWALRH